MTPKPILVIGKKGQLARSLSIHAAARATELVTIGRPEIDIASVASIERVLGSVKPRVIINAAAYTAVDRAEIEEADAFAINCDGAAHLAAAAARRDIPFIHVSTDYVFDGTKGAPYVEEDMPAPINVYGRSKLFGEQAVLDSHPQAMVFRSSWIYSAYGHNFLLTMLRLAATQPIVRVVNDQYGTPTCASDLASAIIDAAQRVYSQREANWGGVYNLTNRGGTTWYGFAHRIFSNLALQGESVPQLEAIATSEFPTPAMRPSYSCLDSSKAERLLQIKLPPWHQSFDAYFNENFLPRKARAC
jgi:dTDP-4-dehydrorhamnose reductase